MRKKGRDTKRNVIPVEPSWRKEEKGKACSLIGVQGGKKGRNVLKKRVGKSTLGNKKKRKQP